MVPDLDAIVKDAARAYVDSAAGSFTRNAGVDGFCDEVRDHELDLVEPELSAFMHRVNAANCPSSLPAELLAEIFLHLSVGDRFSVSEVCHQWRMATMQYSRVWMDLGEFGMISPRLCVALGRTGSLPFRLGFVLVLPAKLHTSFASPALRFILSQVTSHVHHLAALRVTLFCARIGLSTLLDALTVPAPLLTELSIHVVSECGAIATLREDLFAGHAPKLGRLSLRHILLPTPPIPALSGVTYMHLKMCCEHPLSYETVHRGLPSLVKYELDMFLPPGPNLSQASFPATQTLQIVRLLRPCKTPAVSFLPYARCPRLSIVGAAWPEIAGIWESALAAPTRMIALRMHGSTLLGGQNHAGVTRLFRDVNKYKHTADLLAHAAPHLRALVMDTGRWPQWDMTELAFPVLRHLHVVIRPTGGSLPARPLLPVWMRAPALRTLRVDVSESAAGRLSGELAIFMMRAKCRAPVSLELQGAEVEHVPEGMVQCPVSGSLDVLSADPVDVMDHWDDWLTGALAQMQDL